MKKIIILILLLAFTLISCKQSTTFDNTPSDDIDGIPIVSNEEEEEENDDPYPLQEITDERIKIADNKKVFSDLGITFSFPVDWIGMELNAEDLSSYSFRHPEFENASFDYYITGATYLYDVPNEDEYINKLSDNLKNLKIHSFTKDTLSGYECKKIVFSYTSEDTEFIHINYEYVIVGFAGYSFSIKYPSTQSETYEGVFESIVNSIVFKD